MNNDYESNYVQPELPFAQSRAGGLEEKTRIGFEISPEEVQRLLEKGRKLRKELEEQFRPLFIISPEDMHRRYKCA